MDRLKSHRKNYGKNSLNEQSINSNPFLQFKQWLDDAFEHEKSEPNAMTMATANAKGIVSARILLLKELDNTGFIFYTNFDSRKAQDLQENPNTSLLFWWPATERQVRIEGCVEKIDDKTADAYYESRSRDSKLGAYASKQSKKIADRNELDNEFKLFEQKFKQQEHIPRPKNWGGYRVIPNAIEFWQGGAHRLHDRYRFEKNNSGNWEFFRLAP